MSVLPEHPSPIEALDNDGTDQRDQVFAAKEQQGVDADAESTFVQKEDFRNGSGWEALDGAHSDTLEDTRQEQRGVAGRQSTPNRREDKDQGTEEIDGPFAVEDSGGRKQHAADAEAHHVQARCQRNLLHFDVVICAGVSMVIRVAVQGGDQP